PKLDGQAYQQRLILAIVALFRTLPESVLLLLEDLQWTGESLAVLQQMLKVMEQLPGVMVLGNYRHDERSALPGELPGSQTLILERLDDTEVTKLSQAMLGEVASSPHIVSLLTQETEGNTFFIVEVMRALAEEAGQLDEIGHMTLPEGVFTGGMSRLLQRRIQRVAESDQPLLQLAAVAGRQLDEVLLQQLASGVDITAWQQRIGDAAVLSVRDNQWWFTHDKLREALLLELDDKKQKGLHRQVAEALETVYPDDSNYDEALLGHWHQADVLDKEIHYLNPVAENLVSITAEHERARTLLVRGLALLPSGDGRRVALLNWQAKSYWRQGHYAEGEVAAQAARSLAEQGKDQAGLAESLSNLGRVVYYQGDYAAARDYYQQSLAIFQVIGDQHGIALSLGNLGLVANLQGDYAAARNYHQQGLAIFQVIGDQHGIAKSLGNLGLVADKQGDYAAARDYYQQGLAIFQALGEQRSIGLSFNNLGLVADSEGDYAAAHDYHQQSLTVQQTIGDQWGIGLILGNLGWLADHQGDYAAARDFNQQSLAIFQALGEQHGIANSLVNLSFVHLRLNPEQAGPSFRKALLIAQDIRAIPLILEAIVGLAWLTHAAQPTRAGELAGLAQHHPAHSGDVQYWLDKLRPQLEAALPPAELQAALARGKSLDLDSVVAELLEEFAENNA
ncbi:MAG: tetratricopeptide repeat protein, partial [Gammaproteobacteria bacterium]|nr:tetratricopeptide repeat protein [Gammaproteobacteria bacterium]